MENYRILQVIGEGTYGKVFKAQERDTGRVVAIKKFKQREEEDPHVKKTMMREIRILKEQRHVNIVNLRHHFRENGKLYLIFDYVQKTLLEELQASPGGLPFERIQSIMYQILLANNFLHEGNIIHRDIKPENLLISKAGLIKLCDFGFARPLNSAPNYQYTDYVSTRWYRAPELLVGDAAYSGTVDVWAIGCIFAEIFNGMPLFPGDSDLHTLQLILETITADDLEHNKEIQELSKKQRVAFRMNPLFENMQVPKAAEAIKTPETIQEVSLKALLKEINDTQLDFLRRCLVIDGGLRATLKELLEHPIFDAEFKSSFDAKVQAMLEEDERQLKVLMSKKLRTKDGRSELDPDEIATEEEKVDDEENEEDDEDDFDEDDDDDSSAIGSDGSSGISPDSSSGVGDNKRSLLQKRQDSPQPYDAGSHTTSVPNVGDGLVGSTDGSLKNFAAPHSIQLSQKTDVVSEKADESKKSKVLLLSSKPLASNDQQTQVSENGTSNGPSEEQKPVKDLQKLRASMEQLQNFQVTSSERKPPSDTEMVVIFSKSPGREASSCIPSSPDRNYNGAEQKASEAQLSSAVQAKKRASLIQYMIEQSITEEVREENNSEKTSSEGTSQKAAVGFTELEDHVMVHEGGATIFTHAGSRQDTEEVSGALSTQGGSGKNKGHSGNVAKIKLGAQIIIKDASNSKGFNRNAELDSYAETKQTSDRWSSEMRRKGSLAPAGFNEGQVSRARTIGNPISQTQGSQVLSGTQNQNSIHLKQQHTEVQERQANKSNGTLLSNQLQQHPQTQVNTRSVILSSPEANLSYKQIPKTIGWDERTSGKWQGLKQTAVLKQTSSSEKLDHATSSPQKLPNLKQVNSSMSQYGQVGHSIQQKAAAVDEKRMGEGLISYQKANNIRQGPNSMSNQFNSQQQKYNGAQIGQSQASGSSQSLKTKMNFTSSNYHRVSNSQINESSMTSTIGKVASITIPDMMSAKKSQLVQPHKLVAFPKLMTEENQNHASPTNRQNGIMNFSITGQGQTQKVSTVGTKPKATTTNTTMFQRAAQVQRKVPQGLVQESPQLTSKTQQNKVPKRYSYMGIVVGSVPHNAQFTYNQAQSNEDDDAQTFHPSLTNEYMLSQDSLVLKEVNSRQSSTQHQEVLGSVESRANRSQVASHLTSNQGKSRAAVSNQVTGNASFTSPMKSKNTKFIQQNSHQSKGVSVNSSTTVQLSKNSHSQGYNQKPPQTSTKKMHQHFLEEFQELNSQRQSLTRSKQANDALVAPSQPQLQKTPMTSLFQKSKFFQSATSNEENNNPNIHGAPPQGNFSLINHYGQYQQSSSPNRTLHKQNDLAVLGNFTETKDSFPRRNITNKLRNANNALPKKTKFVNSVAPDSTQVAASPSPLSFYGNRPNEKSKIANGVVLPNLSSSGNPSNGTAQNNNVTQVQPQLMQVSLSQLRRTGPEPRNGLHVSQSPNLNKKAELSNLGAQKLSTAVQLNASEFNLRLTNNSQLSGGAKSQAPYQQIVRKQPSVVQPGRTQLYQMYLTPSQNYTSGTTQLTGVVSRASKNVMVQKAKAQGNNITIAKAGQMSSPSNFGEKFNNENSFKVQNGLLVQGGGAAHGSQGLNPGVVSQKVKTETDWHRGSQQMFEVPHQGQQPNHLYRVSNQFLEKSISPQRIQYTGKRGSDSHFDGGVAVAGGNHIEKKMSFTNQSIRRQVGVNEAQEGGTSSGMIGDSSRDSLAVQSPNLLRKKIIAKQQNQIK